MPGRRPAPLLLVALVWALGCQLRVSFAWWTARAIWSVTGGIRGRGWGLESRVQPRTTGSDVHRHGGARR